jgi:hypothetical protein
MPPYILIYWLKYIIENCLNYGIFENTRGRCFIVEIVSLVCFSLDIGFCYLNINSGALIAQIRLGEHKWYISPFGKGITSCNLFVMFR